MCKCYSCEMLNNEPIKVIDKEFENPFMEDLYHFEEGYKCSWNGYSTLDISELKNKGCRLVK